MNNTEDSKEREDVMCADPTLVPEPVKKVSWPVSGCFGGASHHPMQLLQARASELSGVSYEEANAIDDLSLGEQIGEYNMMQLSESFYKKILNDKDDWFRDMFSGRDDFPGDQNEFFLQRLGGPSYYSDRKGNPSLIHKHANFEMSPRTAERWLEYMDETLEEVENNKDISSKEREIMMAYFRWQAYLLVASQEASHQMSAEGPNPPNTDKPGSECPYPIYSGLKHQEELDADAALLASEMEAHEAAADEMAQAAMDNVDEED
jgi:truncated hemoglobin YjbI